jgi:hypothetical protein
MIRSILLVLIAFFVSHAAAAAPPTVLTFDDINTPAGNTPMPPGYGGLSWPINMGVSRGSLPVYAPQSPPKFVLFDLNNDSGRVESLVTFISGPKIFDGAYFSGYYDVQLKLYSGVTLVSTSSILSLGDIGSGPTFLESGYAGPVDSVGIVGERGYFVMDNFTFEQVPEPSALTLLVVGAISLLGYRKTTSHG